jgi:hypothetical protein
VGGGGLIFVGAAMRLVGFYLPRKFEITVGRNQVGEIISLVLGPILIVAGVVALVR